MPVINRLQEVKEVVANADVEAQESSEEAEEHFMDDFFNQVKDVKEDMRVMGKKMAKIEAAYSRALNEVKIEKAAEALPRQRDSVLRLLLSCKRQKTNLET